MRKIVYTALAMLLPVCFLSAEDFTVGTTGNSYNMATITVNIGDRITIQATASHPTTQVSQATWNANGTTPIGGGFVGQTSSFTIMAENLGTIYYVCENHVVSHGMKGRIIVEATTGVEESIREHVFQIINNPVSEVMHYKMQRSAFEPSQLTIYDLKGMQMTVRQIVQPEGSFALDLPAGNYVYVIRNRETDLLATGQLIMAR